jgi:hypothetical protein
MLENETQGILHLPSAGKTYGINDNPSDGAIERDERTKGVSKVGLYASRVQYLQRVQH